MRYVGSVLLSWCLLVPVGEASVADWVKSKATSSRSAPRLDADTAAAGLREALEKGTLRAIEELGRDGGFGANPSVRIPVPARLRGAERTLRRIGQGRIADEFVRSLNQAAEQATPVARDIFVDALRRMSIRDALGILRGPPDAATQYFRRQSGEKLTAAFRPIVQRATRAVGVTARYQRLLRHAEPLGVIDTRDLDLDDYVTRKAIDGLFYVVAAEEERIRRDPVARTTQLLRRVFR